MNLRVEVPASSANLGPGFDVLAVALDFHNIYEVVQTGEEIRVEVEGEGAGRLPVDKSNLFVESMTSVFHLAGREPEGLLIRERNQIPLARGLGSSAATIVGGLLAGRALTGERLTDDQILAMAADLEGHPDNVAAALFGGLTLTFSSPGKVRASHLPWPEQLGCALFVPDLKVSTASAREVLPETYKREDVVHNLARVALFASALMDANMDDLREATKDRLHQQYRAQLVPGLAKIIEAALQAGAAGAFLSGAGPTVLAIYDKEAAATGDAISAAMVETGSAAGLSGEPLVVDISHQGAWVEELNPV